MRLYQARSYDSHHSFVPFIAENNSRFSSFEQRIVSDLGQCFLCDLRIEDTAVLIVLIDLNSYFFLLSKDP